MEETNQETFDKMIEGFNIAITQVQGGINIIKHNLGVLHNELEDLYNELTEENNKRSR